MSLCSSPLGTRDSQSRLRYRMETKAESQTTYEQLLVNIVRTPPTERIAELLDFARFLQVLEMEPAALKSEDKWERLLATPAAQRAMLEMAREDFRAGRATDIAITDDGRLTPK